MLCITEMFYSFFLHSSITQFCPHLSSSPSPSLSLSQVSFECFSSPSWLFFALTSASSFPHIPFTSFLSSFPNSVPRFFPPSNFLSSCLPPSFHHFLLPFSNHINSLFALCQTTPSDFISSPSLLPSFHPLPLPAVLFSCWGFLREHCCHSNRIMTPKVFKTSFHRSKGGGFTVYYCSTINYSSYTYCVCSIRRATYL